MRESPQSRPKQPSAPYPPPEKILGTTELGKKIRLRIEQVIADEWAAQHLHIPIGTVETMIQMDNGVERDQTHPTASHFLQEQDYSRLYEMIQTPEQWEIVQVFFEKLMSHGGPKSEKEAREKLAQFYLDFPECENREQYAYLKHTRTFRKIVSIDQVPTVEEVLDLLEFAETERLKKAFGGANMSLMGLERLLYDFRQPGYWFSEHDMGKNHRTFHYLTKEFMETLATKIKAMGITGPIVELAAGTGKLSYVLRELGVPAIATDIKGSQFVEEIDALEALKKYQPELVIASWLLPGGEIAYAAMRTPSVKIYVSIENTQTSHTRVDKPYPDYKSGECEHDEELEMASIPTDLLEPCYYYRGTDEALRMLREDRDLLMRRKESIHIFRCNQKD